MSAKRDGAINKSVEMAAILTEVAVLLRQEHLLENMRKMDSEVADNINCDDYQQYLTYKNQVLQELGKRNVTSGANGALGSAIERGFILGYWFARHPGVLRPEEN
jgi:hypothetical protein